MRFRLPSGVSVPDVFTAQSDAGTVGTTYFDTADLRLTRMGATLRYRDEEGWTAKLPGRVDDPVRSRRHVTTPGGPGELPSSMVALVSSLTRGRDIGRVAVVRTRRRTMQHGVGALVDDEIEACDPGGEVLSEFREIELELAPDATTSEVESVLEQLRSVGASPAGQQPTLVQVLGRWATAPPDVDPPTLVSEPTLRDVIQLALATCTKALLLALPGVRLDEDLEDVHQARVAIRRFRSNLRTFRPLVDSRWAVALDDDLRQLGSALGDVRDLDVLIDTMLPMPIQGSGREELLASLAVERESALAGVVDLLDSPWASELLERLVDGAADPMLAPQADDAAPERLPALVAKPWRRLRRAVDMLTDPPRDDDLHSVRILSKRCRYSCDAVRPALGKPARRMARRLAAIQDSLGALNDAVVITARLTALTPTLTPAAVFAAGQVSGVLKERAVEHHNAWESAWQELDRKAVTGWLP